MKFLIRRLLSVHSQTRSSLLESREGVAGQLCRKFQESGKDRPVHRTGNVVVKPVHLRKGTGEETETDGRRRSQKGKRGRGTGSRRKGSRSV